MFLSDLKRSHDNAFSLIEVLIVILVIGIISAALMNFFSGSLRINNQTISVYNSVQQTQIALKPVIEKIKYAVTITQPNTSTSTNSLTLTDAAGNTHLIDVNNNILRDSINSATATPLSKVPIGSIKFTLQNTGILITIKSKDLKYSYETEVHKLN